ncbi:MAG: YeeE/YedE thiosulfate transporter family protein [Oceanospirillaceae bacterium]
MIDYAHFTPISALIGGSLIGISSVILLLVNGRVSGISGITNQLFNWPSLKTLWAWLFLVGLLLGSWFSFKALSLQAPDIDTSWLLIITSGLLVGFGSKLGSGCTSGHGVCGIGRFSIRSIAATVTFLTTGAISLFLLAFFTQ